VARVRLEGVGKAFDARKVLSAFSLEIAEGEFFVILGPSGCGKTTLLRLVAGFERPESGEIWIGDDLVAGRGRFAPPERRGIGIVFQNYAVWPHRSVFDNVAYPLKKDRAARHSPAEIRRRVLEALDLVGLDGLEGRFPEQLSGGQQQRVALARALVRAPRVLLLDEPLSNLDAALRDELRGELRRLQRRLRLTVLHVTHDQTEALTLADRILILDGEGRPRAVGSPEALYDRAPDPFVHGMLGPANLLPVAVRDRRVFLGETPLLVTDSLPESDGEALLACRPKNIALARDDDRAVVRRVAFLGSRVEYQVEIAGRAVRVQEEPKLDEFLGQLHPGERCGLIFRQVVWYGLNAECGVRNAECPGVAERGE
jgi:iron(III) transport system ATP-binding protein